MFVVINIRIIFVQRNKITVRSKQTDWMLNDKQIKRNY